MLVRDELRPSTTSPCVWVGSGRHCYTAAVIVDAESSTSLQQSLPQMYTMHTATRGHGAVGQARRTVVHDGSQKCLTVAVPRKGSRSVATHHRCMGLFGHRWWTNGSRRPLTIAVCCWTTQSHSVNQSLHPRTRTSYTTCFAVHSLLITYRPRRRIYHQDRPRPLYPRNLFYAM